MTVKELVETLKEFDPDADVYLTGGDGDYAISCAEKDEHGDCALY